MPAAQSCYYFPSSVFAEHPDEQWWSDTYEALRASDRASSTTTEQ